MPSICKMYFPKGKNQKPFHSDLVEFTGFYDYIFHLPNQKNWNNNMTIFRISICGCFSFHQLLRHLEKDVHVPLAPWILPRYCPAKNRAKRHLPKWEVHWWVCLYSHIHPVWDIFFDVLWCFFEPWNFCFSITVVLWRIGMDFSDGKYLKVAPRFQITTLNQWTMIAGRPQTTSKVRLTVPWVYQSHGHKFLQELTTQSSHDKAWSFRLETRLRNRGGWWFGVLPCPTRTFWETSRLATTSLHFHGCHR